MSATTRMTISAARELWKLYCAQSFCDPDLGFTLDVSRVDFDDGRLERLTPAMSSAFDAMEALEAGAIANPTEGRMVGHYWLRAPQLAPDEETRRAIRDTIDSIKEFARRVRGGEVVGTGGPFRYLLHVGIGGSALGPQLLAEALGSTDDPIKAHFIDNTDPDGIDRVLAGLKGALSRTLVTVASKSGGTPEPANATIEVRTAFEREGLGFPAHAVAITVEGSRLDVAARSEGWLARFPLWEWVGGRTSVTGAPGLLPAALLGIDVDEFLAGAAAMDRLSRRRDVRRNPAALLALAWHSLGDGRGGKDMVVLPYKDRLLLLSRYLQQLVMESLGKGRTRGGDAVRQGLAVYGNKGSTDQHAYVQQLREGLDNFFVTFVQVLEDRARPGVEVEPGITAGDYLFGFLQGTRRALYENGRKSIAITVERISPRSIGALIALYERAVGLYAELVDVNAYDQPGVEAGKKAAAAVLGLQRKVVEHLRSARGPMTAEQIASAVGEPDEVETVYKVLEHLAANRVRGVAMRRGATPAETSFFGAPVEAGRTSNPRAMGQRS